MLEDLSTFISRINKSYSIAMPRLDSYLSGLQRNTIRLALRNMKFVTDPIPSGGIDFLNSLIVRADIPYLLKHTNDIERLTKIYREYKSPAYSDFLRQYPIKEKCFITSRHNHTSEYLLITDDFDLINGIPFGSDNIKDWLHIRPVRMLSNPSSEILLDITTSRLRYNENPPIETVFSINVIKLLMLYTKYRILFPEQFVENTNNYPFIFKTCILPLLFDNTKTWMMKLIYDTVLLKHIDPEMKLDATRLKHGEKSSFVISSRQSALLEIDDLLTKCANGVVRPDEVIVNMNIKPNWSLYNELNWIMNSHYVGNRGNQYKWTEFVREYFLLTTVIGIYGLQPESNRTLELKKLFDIMTRRMANTKFWMNAGNPFVAKHIQRQFEVLTDLL